MTTPRGADGAPAPAPAAPPGAVWAAQSERFSSNDTARSCFLQFANVTGHWSLSWPGNVSHGRSSSQEPWREGTGESGRALPQAPRPREPRLTPPRLEMPAPGLQCRGPSTPVPAVSLSPECPRVRQAGWVTLPPGPARPGPGSQSRTEQGTGQRGGTRPRAAGAWCLCPEVMLAPTASRAGAWRHQGRRALWDGVRGTVIGPGPCCGGTAHRDRQWHTWGPGGRAAPAERATCGQDN